MEKAIYASALAIKENTIIGHDSSLKHILNVIEKVCRYDINVMILGESGTGKEIIANEIHERSCVDGAFIAVNCSSIPDDLFESMFYGHEKGTFTGAHSQKNGYFDMANKGTLFLDEIAELPENQQAKLLRVLESRKYRRLGSEYELPFTGRILTATHADIKTLVEEKKFREDLYYRLNSIEIKIPPLRERIEDIPSFIRAFSDNYKKSFSHCAISKMILMDWPGNIRQLKHTIDRLCILAEGNEVSEQDLNNIENNKASSHLNLLAENIIANHQGNLVKEMEKAFVRISMKMAGNNISKASRILGVDRKFVERRVHYEEIS